MIAYRVPTDDLDSHTEIIEAAARHLGIYEAPHWRYRLALYGAALILQEPAKEMG